MAPQPIAALAMRSKRDPQLVESFVRSTWEDIRGLNGYIRPVRSKTSVENGLLGNIRFDKNGDPVEAPITIWRIVRPSSAPDGQVADRVVIGRAALLP